MTSNSKIKFFIYSAVVMSGISCHEYALADTIDSKVGNNTSQGSNGNDIDFDNVQTRERRGGRDNRANRVNRMKIDRDLQKLADAGKLADAIQFCKEVSQMVDPQLLATFPMQIAIAYLNTDNASAGIGLLARSFVEPEFKDLKPGSGVFGALLLQIVKQGMPEDAGKVNRIMNLPDGMRPMDKDVEDVLLLCATKGNSAFEDIIMNNLKGAQISNATLAMMEREKSRRGNNGMSRSNSYSNSRSNSYSQERESSRNSQDRTKMDNMERMSQDLESRADSFSRSGSRK